jgi:uncharacterized damage-inducible protein DinB
MLELIEQYYRYNTWANGRILETAAEISPQKYFAETNPNFGSIHNTLVHIMSAQWLWLNRWKGVSLKAMLNPETFPDLTAVRTRWTEIEEATGVFVLTCTEESLARPLSYQNLRGETFAYPLWNMMLHQVNHATQHRSETAMILTQYGHSTGAMDFLVFVDGIAGESKLAK